MHFEFVCEGVTQGMKDLNLMYDIPTIFCVLTDNNMQQSIDTKWRKTSETKVLKPLSQLSKW